MKFLSRILCAVAVVGGLFPGISSSSEVSKRSVLDSRTSAITFADFSSYLRWITDLTTRSRPYPTPRSQLSDTLHFPATVSESRNRSSVIKQ